MGGRVAVLRRRNEEIKDQLANDGAGTGASSGANLDEEIDKLQKQVLCFSEQKDMLMKMVKNVYDNEGDAGADQEQVSQLLTKDASPSGGYGKLLPDPCDIMGGGKW